MLAVLAVLAVLLQSVLPVVQQLLAAVPPQLLAVVLLLVAVPLQLLVAAQQLPHCMPQGVYENEPPLNKPTSRSDQKAAVAKLLKRTGCHSSDPEKPEPGETEVDLS